MRRTGLDDVMSRIGERVLEQDDLLRTVWVMRRSDDSLPPLFDRLADVCLDQLFLEVEFRHVVGELDDDEYFHETARLITQCQTVGLRPPLDVGALDLRDDPFDRMEPPEA